MDTFLTLDDVDQEVKSKVYLQDYSKKGFIDGVKLVELPTSIGEEGYFAELSRLDQNGEMIGFPGFHLAQVNWVKMYPSTVKAWHLHLKQDEIWCVRPDSHLLVGLWDLRKNSHTKGKNMRIVMGEGKTQALFIPKGVAHGSAIVNANTVEMLYFVDQVFDIKNPDEYRINWNSLGADFWKPLRD